MHSKPGPELTSQLATPTSRFPPAPGPPPAVAGTGSRGHASAARALASLSSEGHARHWAGGTVRLGLTSPYLVGA